VLQALRVSAKPAAIKVLVGVIRVSVGWVENFKMQVLRC
jgi:hypothetical protein